MLRSFLIVGTMLFTSMSGFFSRVTTAIVSQSGNFLAQTDEGDGGSWWDSFFGGSEDTGGGNDNTGGGAENTGLDSGNGGDAGGDNGNAGATGGDTGAADVEEWSLDEGGDGEEDGGNTPDEVNGVAEISCDPSSCEGTCTDYGGGIWGCLPSGQTTCANACPENSHCMNSGGTWYCVPDTCTSCGGNCSGKCPSDSWCTGGLGSYHCQSFGSTSSQPSVPDCTKTPPDAGCPTTTPPAEPPSDIPSEPLPGDSDVCGNGACEEPGETSGNCPQDCGGAGTEPLPGDSDVCGNGACEEPGETSGNCPQDCGGAGTEPLPGDSDVCGNGACEEPGETHDNCPGDCPGEIQPPSNPGSEFPMPFAADATVTNPTALAGNAADAVAGMTASGLYPTPEEILQVLNQLEQEQGGVLQSIFRSFSRFLAQLTGYEYQELKDYVSTHLSEFDIDGNGVVDPETDGTLILRTLGGASDEELLLPVCDDGNFENGDGCSETRTVEEGWDCGSGTCCTETSVCGDGLLGCGEQCDPGNVSQGIVGILCGEDGGTCSNGCECVSAQASVSSAPWVTCPGGYTCPIQLSGGECIWADFPRCSDPEYSGTCGSNFCEADCFRCPAGSSSSAWSWCSSGYSCTKAKSTEGQCISMQMPLCDLRYSGASCGDTTCGGSCFRCAPSSVSSSARSSSSAWSLCPSGYSCTKTKSTDGQCTSMQMPICDLRYAGAKCGDTTCGGSCYRCAATSPVSVSSASASSVFNVNVGASSSSAYSVAAALASSSNSSSVSAGSMTCGNGSIEGTEQCDDGNKVSRDGCSATCKLEATISGRCGDGYLVKPEFCDDGNTYAGDGCSANCSIEKGYICPIVSEPCIRASSSSSRKATSSSPSVPVCGDGMVTGAETCDDGNTGGDDGCSSSCSLEAGFLCNGTVCRTVCGDGIVAGPEACDDENSENEDGCSASCTVEAGWECASSCQASRPWSFLRFIGSIVSFFVAENSVEPCPSYCSTVCGDGLLRGEEECDDGNEVLGDGCLACSIEHGWGCSGQPSTCRAVCGDGVQMSNESCDDGEGNSDTDPDVCRRDCTPARCGDGVKDAGEVCDEGAGNSDTLPDSCRKDCTPPVCGDGVRDDGEECDAGEANSDTDADACRTDCRLPVCGDGVKDALEQCDLGTRNGDGSSCRVTCVLPNCGDGRIDPAEACDDGTENSSTLADACRPSCEKAHCGDGVTDTGEQCDQGILNSGTEANACRRDCTPARCGDGVTDAGEQCDAGAQNSDTVANACRTTCEQASCGDSVIDTGEQCDAGAMNSDTVTDACRTTCAIAGCGDSVIDTGEQCDAGAQNSDTVANACRTTCKQASCGDGVKDFGETCDDGVLNSATAPNSCRPTCVQAFCGDGVKDTGEQCDLGTANDNYGICRKDCTLPNCGDGRIDPAEECDAGVQNSDNVADACRTDCSEAHCGDGVLDGEEQCDDGTLNSGIAANACRTNCLPARCGDGVKDAGEQCDDGTRNANLPNLCRLDCLLPRCADHILDGNEQCDDGNTDDGDGCSGFCRLEIKQYGQTASYAGASSSGESPAPEESTSAVSVSEEETMASSSTSSVHKYMPSTSEESFGVASSPLSIVVPEVSPVSSSAAPLPVQGQMSSAQASSSAQGIPTFSEPSWWQRILNVGTSTSGTQENVPTPTAVSSEAAKPVAPALPPAEIPVIPWEPTSSAPLPLIPLAPSFVSSSGGASSVPVEQHSSSSKVAPIVVKQKMPTEQVQEESFFQQILDILRGLFGAGGQ